MATAVPQFDVPPCTWDSTKTPFKGSVALENLFLLYLSQNFGDQLCVPLSRQSLTRVIKLQGETEQVLYRLGNMVWTCMAGQRSIIQDPEFENNLQRCLSPNNPSRFVAFILTLMEQYGCPPSGASSVTNHANIIIIDKLHKTVDRFEPQGTQTAEDRWYEYNILDERLAEHFARMGLTYFSPMCFCPYMNVQALEGYHETSIGFCSAWSLWWLWVRLSNPDRDPRQLLQDMISSFSMRPSKISHESSFYEFIRDFSSWIVSVSSQFLEPFLKRYPQGIKWFHFGPSIPEFLQMSKGVVFVSRLPNGTLSIVIPRLTTSDDRRVLEVVAPFERNAFWLIDLPPQTLGTLDQDLFDQFTHPMVESILARRASPTVVQSVENIQGLR